MHSDTLRGELARLTVEDWEEIQEERLRVLYGKRLIRSTKMVVDGRWRGTASVSHVLRFDRGLANKSQG